MEEVMKRSHLLFISIITLGTILLFSTVSYAGSAEAEIPYVASSARYASHKGIVTLSWSKAYARTSATPGKTQTINYYNINDEFYLVDLPGYGYATAGVKVKQQWGKMIENYLHTSRKLNAVFLLVDIRHEPSDNDVMMFDWVLAAGFTPYVIATKSDKIKRSQIAKQTAMIRRTIKNKSTVSHDISFEVVPFSGLNKSGRDEIYQILEGFLQNEKSDEGGQDQQQ